MKQTKKQSLKEVLTSTFIGFIIAYISTFLIFWLTGIQNNGGKNLLITAYFTLVSILRGYFVRRYYNRKH